MTNCAAIFRRRGDIFRLTDRPSCDCPAGDGTTASATSVRAPPATFSGGAIFSPPDLLWVAPSTSPLVRRPPFPVPEILSASRCSSSTIRRTDGDNGGLLAPG